MYKLVIVDDEPTERRFLRWVVEEYKLPFVVCGEAANGKEALALVEAHRPQFAIIDIRMPIMDGLEAAQTIKRRYPGTIIYILTAYEQFEYARTAIRIKVEDYLLKPVRPEDLVAVLRKGVETALAGRIHGERSRRANAAALHRKDEAAGRVILALAGLASPAEHSPPGRELSGQPAWAAAVVVWRSGEIITEEYLLLSLRREIEGRIAVSHGVQAATGPMILLGKGDYRAALAAVTDGANKWLAETGLSAAIYCAPLGGEANLGIILPQAVAACRRALFWDLNTVGELPVTGPPASALPDPGLWAGRLVDALLTQGAAEVLELTDNVCRGLRDGLTAPAEVVAWVGEYFTAAAAEAGRFEAPDLARSLRQAGKAVARADTFLQLEAVIRATEATAGDCGTTPAEQAVRQAIVHLQRNYHTDLSLDAVAGRLYLSSAYFSRIFKKYTGQGFAQYLTQLRLEKARVSLAAGNYTIAEVAQQVGIQDAGYFSSVFKKRYNVAPSHVLGKRTGQKN